jgi:hypothetical protein
MIAPTLLERVGKLDAELRFGPTLILGPKDERTPEQAEVAFLPAGWAHLIDI